MRKSVIPSRMEYGVYRSSHTLRFTGVQGRFLDFARNDNTGKAILSFSACSRRIFPLSFIPRVPYPPLQGTFPSRGRLLVHGGGILVSPPSPWEKDFGLLPPSFGRRYPEGAEVGSRSGMRRKVRQPILPFRHPERSRGIFPVAAVYDMHAAAQKIARALISHSPFHRCAKKISRFARNDDAGKALLSFSACLRRISPLSFIPPVPYPPLRRTFPSRGRLLGRDSGIFVSPPSPWR